jgi:hypothetical protein
MFTIALFFFFTLTGILGVYPPSLKRKSGLADMVKREANATTVWHPERESKPDYSKLQDKHSRVEMGPVTKRKKHNRK